MSDYRNPRKKFGWHFFCFWGARRKGEAAPSANIWVSLGKEKKRSDQVKDCLPQSMLQQAEFALLSFGCLLAAIAKGT